MFNQNEIVRELNYSFVLRWRWWECWTNNIRNQNKKRNENFVSPVSSTRANALFIALAICMVPFEITQKKVFFPSQLCTSWLRHLKLIEFEHLCFDSVAIDGAKEPGNCLRFKSKRDQACAWIRKPWTSGLGMWWIVTASTMITASHRSGSHSRQGLVMIQHMCDRAHSHPTWTSWPGLYTGMDKYHATFIRCHLPCPTSANSINKSMDGVDVPWVTESIEWMTIESVRSIVFIVRVLQFVTAVRVSTLWSRYNLHFTPLSEGTSKVHCPIVKCNLIIALCPVRALESSSPCPHYWPSRPWIA